MEKELRLDKFLADMAQGSRSQIRAMAKNGLITVNGVTEKRPERKIRIPDDMVTLAGKPVSYTVMEYFMLNKPKGVVSATEDKRHKTVIDLIQTPSRRDLFPVGRLDLDTEGLLLLTNDGALAHRLLSPKKQVDKVYMADCLGEVPGTAIQMFAKGLILPDGLCCLPASLVICGVRQRNVEDGIRPPADNTPPFVKDTQDACGTDDKITTVRLTIREGKFHQVKRMMEAVGCPVLSLKRLSVGPLTLDPKLLPGEYRRLTKKEVELLNRL
ncbi:MAG: rRNA pseudouridine synthase [Lachnospiraceae bacterium]|nr:rRNA pseudouridine synthase [Lachnospiraceae bacterium]